MYEPTQTSKDLYDSHLKQAWADQQASSDDFDRNLLTLSSAFLAASVAFLKGILDPSQIYWFLLLQISWASFIICIVVTMCSFRVSIGAQKLHLEHLEKYYLKGLAEFRTAPNKFSTWLERMTWVGGITALVGVLTLTLFAYKNILEMKMPIDKTAGRKPVAIMYDDFVEGKAKINFTDGRPPIVITPDPTQPVTVTPAVVPPVPTKKVETNAIKGKK